MNQWLYLFNFISNSRYVMKTLIIHPQDPSTTFLSPIYANLRNKTVIKSGITKSELRELIVSHDRVLMLGHGSPYGNLLIQGKNDK